MAYNTTASLDKLTCTDYVDFGKSSNKFGRFSWTKYVVAADNFLRERNLSPVLQSTLSKDMEEQLKLVHKVIDVVDRPNRRICVTVLRYKVNNSQTSYAQVRLFGRKKEEEKFQQIVHVNYKLDEFVYLLDVMNSVHDKVIANQSICNILKKVIATIYSNLLFFLIKSG